MTNFWTGFEKQASNPFRSAGKAVKEWWNKPGFWQGAKNVGENIRKTVENVEKTTSHAADTVKAAPDTAEHVNKVLKHVPESAEHVKKILEKAPKHLKRLGYGALGIYGGAKALELPRNYQQHKYYKNQNKLYNEQKEKEKAKKK